MRTRDYKTTIRAIGAGVAQIVTFNASDLFSDKVSRMHIGLSGGGANNTSNITRIVVKAGGTPIINCTYPQLRSLVQRLSRGNKDMGANATSFTIPFDIFDAPSIDEADQSQFPLGANAQVEISLGAAVIAGNIMIGYTFTDQAAKYYPVFLSQQMSIAASSGAAVASVGAFTFNEPGQIRALTVNTPGLVQLRIILNGTQLYQLAGPASIAAAVDLATEAESIDSGTTAIDPLTVSCPFGQNAAFSKSQLELQTNNAWAGVANETAIYATRGANVPLVGA